MLFFVFWRVAVSTWWNWSQREFKTLVQQSMERPIFVLCYSPYCPHCHGLPEGLMKYNETLAANRTDILISMIDCYHVRGCGLFGLRGTPHMALVLGTKRRYWPVTSERGPEGWDRWINQQIGPNLRQIYNETELEEAKREPKNGGTTFFLEVSRDDDPFIEHLRKLSKAFRIYNDTFVFRVNESIRKPILHAFYSVHCERTYTGSLSGVKAFLDENKFGVFHRYDTEEFTELEKQGKKALLLMTSGKLTEGQINALQTLTQGHCEAGMTFGWADVEDEQKILSATKVKDSDLPLIYRLANDNRPKTYKGKIANLWSSEFMDSSQNDKSITQNNRVKLIKTAVFYIGTVAICYITYHFRRESVSKLE